MDSIGEQISQLAAKFDPDKEADGLASRAFLQGWMYMAVAHPEGHKLQDFFKINNVDQGVDVNGDYEPFFTIVTGSGHRIRVTLELEP